MGWTAFFWYNLRPVNSTARLHIIIYLKSLNCSSFLFNPEQQYVLAEGSNYNHGNPPKHEEFAQIIASCLPVFVD